MHITEKKSPINQMAGTLQGVTKDRLVGAFLSGQKEEGAIRLAMFGQDVMVKSVTKTEKPTPMVGEAAVSRFFRVGEAMFLTGDDELGRLLVKKKADAAIGENILLGYLEAISQVKDKMTGRSADCIHTVGKTDMAVLFARGQLVDYTAITGIVPCDYMGADGMLYGYRKGTHAIVKIEASKINLQTFGRDSWSHVVDGPDKGNAIVGFGQIQSLADGKFSVDVAFKDGKSALLVFGNDDAKWSMMRDGIFAAATVNYGRLGVVTFDNANGTLGIIPKDNLPKALQAYVATHA